MTNNNNSALYTGVTSDLKERILQHKTKKYANSFSAKYNICKLVYFESCETIKEAIKREKQIKAGNRNKKIELINETNPEWDDLNLILDGSMGLPRPPYPPSPRLQRAQSGSQLTLQVRLILAGSRTGVSKIPGHSEERSDEAISWNSKKFN